MFILQHISFFFLSYREEDEVEAKKSLLKHAVFDLMALLVLAIALIGMYLGAGALHFSSIGNAAQAVTSLGSPYQDWARLSLFMVIFYVFSRLRAFPFCFFRDTVPLFLPRAGVLHVICQVFSILFIFGVALTKCFSSLIDIWGNLLFYGGFLSLVWASLTLLFQDDIRKFLSSIVLFYGGMVLMCISVGNTNGLNAALFYSVLFLVNAATLIYFLINVSINDMNISSLSQISGLGQKHPATAIILAVCLLSLASVPPFSGFWTTLYVLKELIFKGWIYVAIILLCIVLSSFQYFHVMRLLYFSRGYNQLDLTESWKSTWLVVPIFLTFFFLFHKHIIAFISIVTNSSWSS
ncbi:MAG: hypothetical protein H6925_05905 [Holosporaceae bacterium]|nr:MAG: hypothetical protein H6925_05905 [Holosporaceae bacterium]